MRKPCSLSGVGSLPRRVRSVYGVNERIHYGRWFLFEDLKHNVYLAQSSVAAFGRPDFVWSYGLFNMGLMRNRPSHS